MQRSYIPDVNQHIDEFFLIRESRWKRLKICGNWFAHTDTAIRRNLNNEIERINKNLSDLKQKYEDWKQKNILDYTSKEYKELKRDIFSQEEHLKYLLDIKILFSFEDETFSYVSMRKKMAHLQRHKRNIYSRFSFDPENITLSYYFECIDREIRLLKKKQLYRNCEIILAFVLCCLLGYMLGIASINFLR